VTPSLESAATIPASSSSAEPPSPTPPGPGIATDNNVLSPPTTDVKRARPAGVPSSVSDTLVAPARIRTVNPDYPPVARAAQLEGDVLLEALVTAEGKVTNVSVLRSVHPLLDESARKAVLKYEYAPARRNGVPEAATVRLTVSFRMR